MSKITAAHVNGYVKLAMVRKDEDVAATVTQLESRGYWLNITVAPWTPNPKWARRAA
jgi:hypothetical protein